MQILRAVRRRGRHGDERGVVAVEAALVLPLVILLVFGMIEFSLMLRDYVSITAAARAGTRVGTASGGAGAGTCDPSPAPPCTPASSPALAQSAADAMQRALTGVPSDSIDYVLVYEANSKGYPCLAASTCPTEAGTTTPTSCTGYANCVMFTWRPTAGADGKGAFRYSSGSWDSKSIDACINTADSLGIYLKATHTWITGLFGTSISLADRSVGKFEPLPTDTCKPGQISAHP